MEVFRPFPSRLARGMDVRWRSYLDVHSPKIGGKYRTCYVIHDAPQGGPIVRKQPHGWIVTVGEVQLFSSHWKTEAQRFVESAFVCNGYDYDATILEELNKERA